MTSIDRRMLLTRGAIGGAALTLTSGAALASVSEDAEVIRRGNSAWATSRTRPASPSPRRKPIARSGPP